MYTNIYKKMNVQSSTGVLSVADPGCLNRIPDPNFSIPYPVSKRFRIPAPDPHQRI